MHQAFGLQAGADAKHSENIGVKRFKALPAVKFGTAESH
jgi:hypothetical protein